MKRKLAMLLALALLLGSLVLGACAKEKGAERYFGNWQNDDIQAKIGLEGDEVKFWAVREKGKERNLLECSC